MPSLPEAFAVAIEHHQNGRLQAAEQIYRQILTADPKHAEAWHLLGVIAGQFAQREIAIEYIQKAISLNGNDADFHYNLGAAFHAAGKPDDAITCYRRALELKPNFAETYYNLGNVLKEQGNLTEAVDCFRRALDLKPTYVEAHNNLGTVLKGQGRLDEAIVCYRRALQLKPDFPEAYYNLGNALKELGNLAEAVDCYRQALHLKPNYAEAHNNLGTALKGQGKLDEANACYHRALEWKPHFAEAYFNFGNTLKDQGKLDDAVACYRRALELKPTYADAYSNLGVALSAQGNSEAAATCYRRLLDLKPTDAETYSNLGRVLNDQGKLDEAIACYRRALELNPQLAETYSNWGVALKGQGKLDEAVACFFHALELKPTYAEAQNNLGNLYKDQGELDEALTRYRLAMELNPHDVSAHDNLVYALHFQPDCDAAAIYNEHRAWNEKWGRRLEEAFEPPTNERSPDRRLRIGYVSPDFRDHVVGRNLLPLFREHDHQQVELFGYSCVRRRDEITARFQAYCDTWRSVVSWNDATLAQRIRDDRIDILVDLSLHMAGNRLPVFARKPAPVQVTFAGYPSTTGLTAIDYRLTDVYLDPPGLFDRYYSEGSLRLPDSFWCYEPLAGTPSVERLPAIDNGCVTFGCLNNFAKINVPVLKRWAEVLREVERSRIILLSGQGSHRQRTLDLFVAEGIASERVTFVSHLPHSSYMEVYHGIDVGLDTLPYNGHTTSLDSLWMGVPVITLVGKAAVGRAGFSQLSNLGLSDWVAYSPDEFLRIAVDHSRDLSRLQQLRRNLRGMMQASPLMDARRFTRNIEAAYRQMWQRYCGA